MRPPDVSSLALALLCFCCCGVRALCRECRWRFDSCRRGPSEANCSVVLRQWCRRSADNTSEDCESSQFFSSNETRQETFDKARAVLEEQCNTTTLGALCHPHLCHLLTRPCPWTPFRVVFSSCFMVVRSRTRMPCCHPVTGAVTTCPCRRLNVSCPYVSTYSSFSHTRDVKDCPNADQLDRYGRGHSIYDIEIGLLGVVILLFLIFCSIVGVRRHSWKQMYADCRPLPLSIPRSNSAPHLALTPRPVVFPNPGDPVPRNLLPPTF